MAETVFNIHAPYDIREEVMTAVTTPAVAGARARRRRLRAAGGVVAAMVAIGAAFLWLLPNVTGADGTSHDITCSNAQRVIDWNLAEAAMPHRHFTSGPVGQKKKLKYQEDKLVRAQKAKDRLVECQKKDGTSTTTTSTAPKGSPKGPCDVDFAPYRAEGNRFGPKPVEVSSVGDVGKVLKAWSDGLKSPFQTAVGSQALYLVDGGISGDEVQAKADFYQHNRAEWSKANAKLRAIVARASSVTLERTNRAYNTQEAVKGDNSCVAPGVKDATSGGQKWVLVIHLSSRDGGRTVRLVVDCDFQIQEFAPAPSHHEAAPVTTTTRPYVPPVTTTTRPYVPPPPPSTTAPPPTTTTTVTTTTVVKGDQHDDCDLMPHSPGC